MAREPLTVIMIDPDSELGKALAEPDNAPIILVRNGARFRKIVRIDHIGRRPAGRRCDEARHDDRRPAAILTQRSIGPG